MTCSSTASETLYKKAGEKRRYSMDFSDLMVSGETISGTPTVTDASSDLTISGITVSGQSVLAWIAGGTKPKKYTVVITLTTSSGQILIGEGKLEII